MSDEPIVVEPEPISEEPVANTTTAEATSAEANPSGTNPSGTNPSGTNPSGPTPSLFGLLARVPGGMASGAASILGRTAGATFDLGRAMLRPDRLEMMAESGRYLHDMRELAGLTLMELSESLDLEDKTLLEAVEQGTATLSFDLILRSAALIARHDPVPFVMRMTRTYNPTIWRILNDWGVGRLTLHMERERQFINIFRRHDAARNLSDEGFERVLEFTRSAFEMALHFVAESEGVEDHEIDPDAASETK